MKSAFNNVLKLGIIATLTGCFFGKTKTVDSKTMQNTEPVSPFYKIKISQLEGGILDLAQFKGKKILIVNTASECGFTPQYQELQQLQNKYADKLVIIGTPCNQFGGQEPGTAADIKSFCQKNYGVSFPLTEKLEVKGAGQHELYQWLTKKEINGALDSDVKWNFSKFLISENGKLMAFFPSTTSPMSGSITSLIEK
jgi:glutathione peroxidase